MSKSYCHVMIALLLALSLSRAAVAEEVAIPDETGQPQRLYAGSYALLIGVSNYTNGWRDLPGVKDDVTAVSAALQAHGFQVTAVNDPTGTQLRQALTDFTRQYGREFGNRLLVYFAGHGATVKMADGRIMGYIVPADAPTIAKNRDGFEDTALDMMAIEVYAKKIASKHALFLFDSCFSGSVFYVTRAGVPDAISYKAREPVRQLITSGREDEQVPDRSIFRAQFVAALNGDGDVNRDGYVTGQELGAFLEETVINYSRDTQHPQYGKIREPNLDKGDFVFQLPSTALRVTPATPAPQPPDVAFSLDDLDAKAKWQAYQTKLETAFAQVQAYERSNDVAAALKQEAFQRFAQAFSQDNPYSANDDALRQQAQERLNYWRQQAGKPTPISTPLPISTALDDRQPGETWTDPVTGMEFVYVPADCFQMGQTETEKTEILKSYSQKDYDAYFKRELPRHKVCVDGFWLGKYEVTQAQWQKVVGKNPAYFNTPKIGKDSSNYPVEQVSWDDVQAFIKKLNDPSQSPLNQGGQRGVFRLPTEAEWEYAARAGTTTPFSFGNTISTDQANYDGDYVYGSGKKGIDRGQTTPVGSFPANAFGLYDMHGNVWEWVADTYHDSYVGAPDDGSLWGHLGDEKAKVRRGGSWYDSPFNLRGAYRNHSAPDLRYNDIGARLVRAR